MLVQNVKFNLFLKLDRSLFIYDEYRYPDVNFRNTIRNNYGNVIVLVYILSIFWPHRALCSIYSKIEMYKTGSHQTKLYEL